ncbi:ZIP family metal transporter [Thiohalophilus thiocyanatoxydans]|uniref:Zinc and cadmium transporter n=1 Tax=Thiohalophilus thiocyanatoxydans TaxID=381308 RepID=A0A4R8IMX1_9GAMM|nr:ZIP family metal transporter [Thiohalophilus thiocyanatoxydans]TDY01524.1 zinc and cadmium transporter [Thiohalophilus thiocyanatoxydans]
MSLFTWILLFSLLGGVLSVLAAALFLLIPGFTRERLLPHFVSFAIGALLGAAFLALLPHALGGTDDFHLLGMTVLLGLLGFFLLEKMVLWRHCHHEVCEAHTPEPHAHDNHNAAGTLILIGDGVHNFVDGVLIAAAFMTDIHLGIVTALAVAAHEIPQEVGDFAVLLQSGFSRRKAFVFNVLASLTTLIGAGLAYYSLADMQQALPFVLAIAASSFIYIAVADLIPGLHKRVEFSQTVQQIILILLGVAVIYLAHSTLH